MTDIKLMSFAEWRANLQESGAMRRLKRDSLIRGTMPPIAPNNVNSGGSGTPYEIEQASKIKTDTDVKEEKKEKKKRTYKRKKKKAD